SLSFIQPCPESSMVIHVAQVLGGEQNQEKPGEHPAKHRDEEVHRLCVNARLVPAPHQQRYAKRDQKRCQRNPDGTVMARPAPGFGVRAACQLVADHVSNSARWRLPSSALAMPRFKALAATR